MPQAAVRWAHANRRFASSRPCHASHGPLWTPPCAPQAVNPCLEEFRPWVGGDCSGADLCCEALAALSDKCKSVIVASAAAAGDATLTRV